MNAFFDELNRQRWDDHRFYHHCRINQSLHLFSACCFVIAYLLLRLSLRGRQSSPGACR